MSIEAIAILILLVLAVGGWFTAWCAQDQAAELRKERDLAETSAHSWRMQAGNLETSLALVLDDRDPLGSSLRLVGGEHR